MATSKTVFESCSIAQLSLESSLRPVGNKGVVLEILRRTAASSITIYGAGNSNAGSDDLKTIQTIVSVVAFPLEDASNGNDDTAYATIQTDEKTDDSVVITVPAAKCWDIWVAGYPFET